MRRSPVSGGERLKYVHVEHRLGVQEGHTSALIPRYASTQVTYFPFLLTSILKFSSPRPSNHSYDS